MLLESFSTENKNHVLGVTRRKKIPGTREFNKARVFADLSTCDLPTTHYQEFFERTFTPSSNNQQAAGKINKPSPRPLSFLLENPRFLNEPICFTNSAATRHVQSDWWPSNWKDVPKPTPTFSRHTTSRAHYSTPMEKLKPSTRFGSNRSLNTIATGICPITDIPTFRTTKERISFEHQFDSRRERRERGKQHGSFVWQVEPLPSTNRSTKEPGNIVQKASTETCPEGDHFYKFQDPSDADHQRKD